jgi:serine/threonine-protein kinase
VFVALDGELPREVALKEIQLRHADDPDSRSRFLREAKVTGKLEHPGIVPVYGLGRHADGRPYYAMRFIRGDSLQEAIDRFHRPEEAPPDPGERALEFRKLLGRFLDACNAIAYAHSRGVLHRDLKPANIMLGPYGETLVVDWGLAKAIGQEEIAAGSSLSATEPAGSGVTAAGQALGTPAYMPPEQAAGRLEELGPASDVYSLGATLYHLLTGRPPFTGRDVRAILKQVQAGDFPPPRQVRPDVPTALEAVCLKALALRPEDRYPEVAALVADVEHWLADEPVSAWREPWRVRARRWLGRHRTIVTAAAATALVAVVSLALATVLLTAAKDRERTAREQAEQNEKDANEQRAAAERERDRAEHNFKLARDAVDRYHTTVSENRLLKEPGLQPLRKELLGAAREFYQRFRQERSGDPAVRADLARALFRLASITSEIGSKSEALGLDREALALWRQLAQEHPDDPEYPREIMQCLAALASLYEDTGKVAEDLAARQEAVAVGAEPVRAHPKRDDLQREYLKSLLSLGEAYTVRDRFDEAESTFRQARRFQEKLVRERPDLPDRQSRLALCWSLTAGPYIQKGLFDRAEAACRRAVAELEGLVGKHPAVDRYREALARAYQAQGFVYLKDSWGSRQDRQARAEGTFQKALKAWEELSRKDAANPEYQEQRAEVCSILILVYESSHKPAEAEAVYRQGLAVLEPLASRNPAVTRYQEQLANLHVQIGRVFTFSNQPARAETAYRQAVAIWEKLIEGNPTVLSYQGQLAECLSNLGKVYRDGGQSARAEEAYRRSLKLYEKLAREPATRSNAFKTAYSQWQLANAYWDLGQIYQRTGRQVEADEAHHQHLAILEKLAQQDPSAENRHEVVRRLYGLALLYAQTGQPQQQEATLNRARDLGRQLIHDYPDALDYQAELGGILHRLAQLHANARRWDRAESAHREALALQEKLVGKRPTNPGDRESLAATLNDLGLLYNNTDRPTEAEAALRRALALRERLAAEQPANLTSQQNLSYSLWQLGEVYKTGGRWAEAEAAHRKALVIREKLATTQPGNAPILVFLAWSQNSLGLLALTTGKPEVAVEWFARPAVTLGPVLKKEARHRFARRALCVAHWGRANALARVGRPAESVKDFDRALELDEGPFRIQLLLGRASATAMAGDHAGALAVAGEQLKKSPANSTVLHNAAYVYTSASGAVARDTHLSEVERTRRAEQYASEAVALLVKARATGALKTAEALFTLKSDHLLDPLRSRTDFKVLLADLEKSAPRRPESP